MKRVYLILALAATVGACNQPAEKPAEDSAAQETATTEKAETLAYFGAMIEADGAIDASELAAKLGDHDSLEAVKVSGKINETCKKMGCWMTIATGEGAEIRVKFKDYKFFVPKDADGYDAIFEGKVFRDSVSVDVLKHYAEDAGRSQEEIDAITEPETKLAFEATGVIIKGYEAPAEEEPGDHHHGDGEGLDHEGEEHGDHSNHGDGEGHDHEEYGDHQE